MEGTGSPFLTPDVGSEEMNIEPTIGIALILTLSLVSCTHRKEPPPAKLLTDNDIHTIAIAFEEQMAHTNIQIMQDIRLNVTQQLIQTSWSVPELSSEIPIRFITVNRVTGTARGATETEMKQGFEK